MEESDETSASDAPTSEGSTVTPDSSLEFEDEDFIEDLLGARTPSTPSLSDIHKPGAVPEEEDLAERALARSIDELQSAQKRGKGRSRVARFWLDAAQAEDENSGVDKPPLVELLIASDLRVLKGLLQNWRFGKEEFRSVMHEALSVHLGANFRGKFSLEEIDQFYDLVNPLLEDTISWEHICSYAFEQHLAKDEIRVVSQIPEWGEFTQLMPEGRERVAAIVLHCGGQRRPHYMIVSRPGVITRLDANFRVQQTKQVEELLLPRKTIWVHDAVIMGTLQKMAVALSTKCVLIYDIERDALSKSGRHRVLGFPLIHRISGFTDNVLTKLFFWQDEEHAKKCKLIVCDDGGLVSVFHFYNAFNTLLLTDTEKWRQNIGADQRTDEVNVLLCNGKFEKSCVDAKFNQFQPHAEPARHVLYLPSVKAYITCHPITKGSIVITYARSRRSKHMRILGGCDVFAYDNAHGMLATGGYDGHIRLWRPFHSPEPICIMKGHIKPVIQLLMLTNPADFLLSLCRDAVIRVWDMLGHSCIQVLQAFPLVKDDFYNCLMLHDTIHDRLVFSFDEKMYHVRLAGPRDLGPRSHAATVTGCVYKQSTEQLITAAWDSSISFWAISSGQRVHKMEGCHRKAAITSLALSVNEKFLISGGDDRIIKVWDVSTYGIVHAFDPEHCVCGGAVNSLIAMQGKVIAVGWARFLTQYEVNSCSSFVIHPTFLDSANGHNTYICRAVVVSKAHIVTVSFNLEIIVWNLRTGAVVSRINCMSESSQRVRHTSQHGRKDNVQGKIRTGPATLLKMFPFSVHTTSKGVASNMSMPNSLSTAQEIYEGDQSAKVRSRGTAQSRATAQRGRASAFRRQPRVPRRPLILQDPKDRLTMAGLRGSPRRSDQLSKGQRRLVQNISEREYMLDAEAMGKVGSNDGHYCSSKQHIDAFRVCCAIYLEGRKGTHANLVTSGHDRHVYFWNLITGRCQTKFCPFPEVGGNGFVLCAGSPVGRYLATANDNGDVILWSLHQYATVKKLSDLFSRPHTEDVAPKRHVAWRAHGEEISSLLFVRHIYSPLLVTASVSGVVGLWNVSGESIGLFGQKLHWDLEKRVTATYKRTLAYARGNVRELSPSNRKAYTVTLKPASGTFRSDYTDQQNKHVTSAANGRFPSGPKLAFGNAGSSDANTTSANDRKKQQPSNQKSTANGVSKPSSDRTKACGTERQPVCAGQQSSSAKQPSTAEKPSTRNRSGQPPTVGQQSSPGNRRPSAASIPVSPASHTQSSSHSSHAHQHQPTGQRSADNIQIQDGGKQSRGLGTKPQPDNRRLPATGVTRKASSSLLRSSDGGHPTYKQNQMFRARRQSVLKETPAVERLSSVQRSQSSMEPISDAQKLLVYVGSKSAMARRSYEKSPEKDQTPCLTIDRLTVHDDRLSTERSRTSSLPLAMQVTMRSGIGMVWNDEIPTTQAVDDLYCGYDLPSCEEAKVDVAVQHTPTQRQAARLKWENEGFKESADQLLNHERRTYRKNSRRRSRRRSSSGIPKEDDPLYRESDVFSDASDESLFSASPRAASRQHAAAGAGIIEMRDGDGTFRSIDQESFRSLSRGSDAPIAHRVNNTQPQQDPVPLVSMAAKHTQDPSTASSSFTRTVATVSSGFDHDTLNKHHPGKRRSKPPSLQTRVYEEDSDEPQEAFWDRDSDSE